MNNLKPCPFCGSGATLEDHRLLWVARCTSCGACVLGDRAPEPEQEMPSAYWEPFRQSAVDRWNQRATLTSDDIPPGPLSEDDLRRGWTQQADEHNQWESLDSAEQLDWAQARAIARAIAALKAEPAEESKWDNGFMAGVCVALATVTLHYDSVIWKEIVESVGTDSLLNYAANVNPEDWDLAGFGKYAQAELGKGKPDPAPQAEEVKA
jgi:hypothetical protein